MRKAFTMLVLLGGVIVGRPIAAAECPVPPWSAASASTHVATLLDALPAGSAENPPLIPKLVRQYSPEFQAALAALVRSAKSSLWGPSARSEVLATGFDAEQMHSAYCALSTRGAESVWLGAFDRNLFDVDPTHRTMAITDFSNYDLRARLAIIETIAVTTEYADLLADIEYVWADAIFRIENSLKPKGRRMNDARLDVDIQNYVSAYRRAARDAAPLIILHRYQEAEVPDDALEGFAASLKDPSVIQLLNLERQGAVGRLRAWLGANKGALSRIVESEKRRKLGLENARESVSTPGKAGVNALLAMYGKDLIIDYILAKRDARISVMVGQMQTYFGRPEPTHVTASTVLNDLKKLKLNVPQFSRDLARFELHSHASSAGHAFWASPTNDVPRELFPRRPIVEEESVSLAKVASRERRRASAKAAKRAEEKRKAEEKAESAALKQKLEKKVTGAAKKWLKLPTRKSKD